ncbi:MAG: disulfide oxidoreductase, partial [Qingshengfaniella sp.]
RAATPDEAKTLRQASLQALAPQYHLLADRFYNAPDPEIDFTEQGGLMWGQYAVGKLVAGAEPLKPQIRAFVDDEAGPDVVQKVERRLQHFIDRKIAALFEPLVVLQKDEALTGLARGFAFRMVEAMGVLPRADVADEVKALDQQARGTLRKHGIRFGQFTIFMPLLLKPAPTRLRLVLWSLANNLDEFPESPPPGLVTVPVRQGVDPMYHTLAGYRAAGERAIRIDMLERLADMLRAQDSRAGFEATPDMLSITGMTLEQFSVLMQGLGYAAERGERAKVRVPAPEAPAATEASGAETVAGAAPTVADQTAEVGAAEAPAGTGADPVTDQPATDPALPEAEVAEGPAPEAPIVDVVPQDGPAEGHTSAAPTADAPAETEVFYTFTWAPRRRNTGPRRQGGHQGGGKPDQNAGRRPQKKGKPGGKGRRGDEKPSGPKVYEAKPRRDKPIDPDNPFAAALMGLRDRG